MNSNKLLAFLRQNNYTGQFNQALGNYLRDQGYSGQLNNMLNRFLTTEGYEGSFNKKFKEWTDSLVPSVGGLRVVPVIAIGASNTAGGDDSDGAALSIEDEDSRIVMMDFADGVFKPIDISVGIPRPGGVSLDSTCPAIHFTKALADSEADANTVYALVNYAVGGRGVYAGSMTMGIGPWSPDGVATPYDIGGDALSTTMPGALFLGASNIKTALDAALAAQYPEHTVESPIFFGHPCNENDTPGPFSTLLDLTERAMTGIRAAFSAPNAPWVIYGGPPEWTYQATQSRKKITAVNHAMQSKLAYVAFVEGLEGYQHPTEDIHYNNAGYRLLGAKVFQGLAVAQLRSVAIDLGVDFIDALTNQPARYYGVYRGRAAYLGALFRVSNGLTETDINSLADGSPDVAAMETHAALNAGNLDITVMYDQMGTGNTMVPEGTATARIMEGGDPTFQGRLIAWGNDSNNILLVDTSYVPVSGGAVLVTGRTPLAGNRVTVGGPQGVLAVGTTSGTTFFVSGGNFNLVTGLKDEPVWLSGSGYYTNAALVYSGTMQANGGLEPSISAAVTAYSGANLAWGGRQAQTTRYAAGSHTSLAVWAVAPTSTDLEALVELTGVLGATDALDFAA